MKIENQYSEQHQKNESEETPNFTDNSQENKDIHDEFKITVRKLEIPVHPRGVLAE